MPIGISTFTDAQMAAWLESMKNGMPYRPQMPTRPSRPRRTLDKTIHYSREEVEAIDLDSPTLIQDSIERVNRLVARMIQ